MNPEQAEGPDVLYERQGAVAILTLNRSRKLNALRNKTIREFTELLESIEDDPEVRAVVLTGTGRAFCAGADIFEYSEMKGREEFMRFQMRGEKLHEAIENLSKPVVAAVNGLALGGGFELALTCDMIVASDSSQFGFPEIKIGLIPGGGGTQRLPRLVGPKAAKKIFMTGEPISPLEALRLNIVSEVVPGPRLMERSLELAGGMASMSPQALAALKRLVNMGTAGSFGIALPYERMMVTYLYDTEESKSRVKDFVDKRKAR
ncbi:MAG: enoyl-CoA hydratase/isomerase family protein [Nitrososphaerales archaeon]|jgi:enoyl-CoA hydratase/carnithine racemase